MCDDFKRKLGDMEDIDENTIENKPWAQHLLTSCLKMTRKAVLNWCSIICKIGEAELDTDEYVSIFIHQIKNLYEDLIADVDAIQEKSLDKIMKLLQKMQNLCRDLHLEIPMFNYEELSLSEIYRLVHQRVEEYETMAEIRRKELRELQEKQMKLCKSLGKELKLLSESPLSLPKDIDKLRMHVESLENEAMEREEKFFQLKEEILEIVSELGAAPSLDFEKDILNMTNTEVRIADTEMEQLDCYHHRLVQQLSDIKEEVSELKIKIDDLWDKLKVDIAERGEFREKWTGNSLETLEALKKELNRLEEMKKANMTVFISNQRQELVDLWEKCHCTEKETIEFPFFYSECYNEDLFELHDREIQKWKVYYGENQELFALLDKYKKLWKDHMELELNSGGANRYKNRGGQLLTEEKLRNKFRKRLPKIEESLLKLAENYYLNKGKHFLTFGCTVEEYIHKLHDDADKEFKLKLSANKQQNLFLPSTSALNPTLTPRHCSKRKIIGTSITEPIKKLERVGTASKASHTGMPKLNVSLKRRKSAKREKLRQRLSFKSSANKENRSDLTDYHDFEKEVSTHCRSTGYWN